MSPPLEGRRWPVQVWRDRRRSSVVKVVWTVVMVGIPVVGVLGWAVNWALGRAADALDRTGHPSA